MNSIQERAAWFTMASLSSTMPSSGIGSMETQKLKPYHMENLYTTLSKTPCGSYVEGKKQELTEKQKQRFLSDTTIHEVHRLLGTAFQYAVEWGILVKSPVPVDIPKKSTQERTIWTVEEIRAALDSMDDPILHLAVQECNPNPNHFPRMQLLSLLQKSRSVSLLYS